MRGRPRSTRTRRPTRRPVFFLAVLVWATLGTEPPKIVKVYTTLDDCLAMASKQNKADGFGPPRQKFVCLEMRGEA